MLLKQLLEGDALPNNSGPKNYSNTSIQTPKGELSLASTVSASPLTDTTSILLPSGYSPHIRKYYNRQVNTCVHFIQQPLHTIKYIIPTFLAKFK